MNIIPEPTRQRFEDWLHLVLKPDVSAQRQILAVVATLAALALSFMLYGHVNYAWCHLLAGAGVYWLVYAGSSSPPLALVFTVASILYNELVFDLAKPGHPHIDFDHIAAGFFGVAVGRWALVRLRGIWPGREWTKKPRSALMPY